MLGSGKKGTVVDGEEEEEEAVTAEVVVDMARGKPQEPRERARAQDRRGG